MTKQFLQFGINGIIFWTFIATILGFFSKYSFLADICSHFRLQYFLIAIIGIIFYRILETKDRKVLIFILVVLCLNFAEIVRCANLPAKTMSENKTVDNKKQKIRIGLINLLTSNRRYELVKNKLLKNDADILIVEEINLKWSDKLADLKEIYKYQYEHTREDNFGLAVYSKIPVKFDTINAGMSDEMPIITATANLGEDVIEIIALHTTPPICDSYFKNTGQMLDDISKYIRTKNTNTVVAGDINSSRYSYNYKNFIKMSKLSNTGNIFQLTWPSYYLLPFRIQLDHIFVSENIEVENFKVGKYTGSDHFPVFVDVFIK